MKTFTVHSPPEDNRPDADRVMDYVFIKEGFSVWAALFGPFWALANKMWMEAGIFIGAIIVGSIIMDAIGLTPAAISGAILASYGVFGLFARDLQRAYYERIGYKLVSVVKGKTREECELRYFRTRQ